MKKLFSAILAVSMLFICVGCSSSKNDDQVNSIVATYSVKSADGDFIVEVQDLGGVYSELYDKDGITIKFSGKSDEIYDKDGNKLERSDLSYGDTLEIQYSGQLPSKSPKTIKAIKVIKMS